jgi:enamine deaminase RidA (YjgF/YER057c/UK114 family)
MINLNEIPATDEQLPEVNERVTALATFLECGSDDIDEESNNCYSMGGQEYLVLTDSEADEEVVENVKQSAWAFNASFLSGYTGLPEEMFTAVQEKCEGANDAILRCIEQAGSIEDFASDAVSADGRGHFLSGYDGDENEQGEYFIYRTN